MWVFSVSYNATKDLVSESQGEFQKKYTPADFSHFQTVEVDEGEFVIIESEPEFEVELNLFSIQTKSFDIIKSSLEKKSNSYVTTLFSSKEIIPLYDLYCNWKFHLS